MESYCSRLAFESGVWRPRWNFWLQWPVDTLSTTREQQSSFRIDRRGARHAQESESGGKGWSPWKLQIVMDPAALPAKVKGVLMKSGPAQWFEASPVCDLCRCQVINEHPLHRLKNTLHRSLRWHIYTTAYRTVPFVCAKFCGSTIATTL